MVSITCFAKRSNGSGGSQLSPKNDPGILNAGPMSGVGHFEVHKVAGSRWVRPRWRRPAGSVVRRAGYDSGSLRYLE